MTRNHTARSAYLSLAMLVGASALLVGCKSGGGGTSAAASSSPTASASSSTSSGTSSTSSGTSATTSAAATAPAASSAPVNSAPQLTGSVISSVAVNSTYSFVPAAVDADGDALSFQIQNKPVWATFSTVNGKLSGTPQTEHAGSYANILISATDGKSTASLPAFSIQVTKTANGTASLSWTAPTQNVDGSAISDLAGFTVVYGESQTALNQTLRIDNSSVTQYMVQSLPAGTYYFAVKAFNASGAESALSDVVSKVIM